MIKALHGIEVLASIAFGLVFLLLSVLAAIIIKQSKKN